MCDDEHSCPSNSSTVFTWPSSAKIRGKTYRQTAKNKTKQKMNINKKNEQISKLLNIVPWIFWIEHNLSYADCRRKIILAPHANYRIWSFPLYAKLRHDCYWKDSRQPQCLRPRTEIDSIPSQIDNRIPSHPLPRLSETLHNLSTLSAALWDRLGSLEWLLIET